MKEPSQPLLFPEWSDIQDIKVNLLYMTWWHQKDMVDLSMEWWC